MSPKDLPSDPSGAPEPAAAPFRTWWKGALFVAFAAVLPFVGLGFLWHGRCLKDTVQTISAPKAGFTAKQVAVNCGQRMRPATEVQLQRMQDGKVADSATVLILPTDAKLRMSWDGDQTLMIHLPGSQSQVVKYRREWGGVRISLIGEILSSTPKNIEDF